MKSASRTWRWAVAVAAAAVLLYSGLALAGWRLPLFGIGVSGAGNGGDLRPLRDDGTCSEAPPPSHVDPPVVPLE